MKKLFVMMLVVLTVVSLVACSKTELVGTWQDESTGQMLVFNDDGTCSFANMNVDYDFDKTTLNLMIGEETQSMQYAIENEILTLSFPDLDDFELTYVRVSQ